MSHWIKTTLLLILLSGLVLLMGRAWGGREGLTIAFVLVLIMNFGSYWFSDQIVLKMHRAVPLDRKNSPELWAILDEVAQKANLPTPKLYWMATASPNAFATGRSPKHAAVAVTQGLVELLNTEEVKGVLAHEMGHVAHRDTLTSTIVATLAGVISYLAMMMRGSLMFGGYNTSRSRNQQANPVLLILFAFLLPVAAAMIQFAVSRTREYSADDKGAELSGNPLYLASALQKLSVASRRVPMTNVNPAAAHLFIVNPLAGVNFTRLFQTHPPIEERIARLEAMAR